MIKESRGKKVIINTIVSLSQEFIALLCGLIITRLILSHFGSAYNGITSSITQFISCIALMRAGIGGVTKAALYKPLAEKNIDEISAIISQTERYMRRVAIAFVFCIVAFASLYPFLISNEFDWLFSFSLILIIALTTFAQYFFGITYQMLLEADQQLWVTSLVNCVALVANAVISAILIYESNSIHIVKLGSSSVFVISSLYLFWYARRKYGVVKVTKTAENKLKQKWDALAHEFANFVNSNSDVIILTFFTSLTTISVYTIYAFVTVNLRKIIKNFTVSFGPSFGNMNALGQKELINSNFKLFELIVFSVVSILYSTALPMITPFVLVYTSGVIDVNYNQPLFGFILVLVGVLDSARIPYETVVKSFGYYRQTRNGAFFEAFSHIFFSVILTYFLGLLGVALGGLLAISYRTFQFVTFLSNKVIHRNISIYFKHLISSLAIMIVCSMAYMLLFNHCDSIGNWIFQSLTIFLLAIILTIIKNYMFFKNETIFLINKIKVYRHE